MATDRRRGYRKGYWDTATVSANAISLAGEIGRNGAGEQFCIYITVDKASTFQIQVAHTGDIASDGTGTDQEALDLSLAANWYDLGIQGVNQVITFTGAGNQAYMIPQFEPNWVRLKCLTGSSVAVTAGWEAWGI